MAATPPILIDAVWETTQVNGKGPATLLGAKPGYQPFSAFGVQAWVWYTIRDTANNLEETGLGQLGGGSSSSSSGSSTSTLFRFAGNVVSPVPGVLTNFVGNTADVISDQPSAARQTGLYSQLPKAGIPGRRFFAYDTVNDLFDNGTAWIAINDPAGAEKQWPNFGSVPSGWLLENGQLVSRTTYPALFAALTFTQAGVMTGGSATITGLSDTSNMYVGMAVTSAGSTLSVNNQISFTGNTTSGSTTVSNLSNPSGVFAGMAVTGATIPGGTTIVSVNVGASTMVISKPASATATAAAMNQCYAILSIASSTSVVLAKTQPNGGGDTFTFYLTSPGNGSTTFNVPDMRGLTPVGADPVGIYLATNKPLAGQAFGEENHTLTTAELASHSHELDSAASGIQFNAPTGTTSMSKGSGAVFGNTNNTGGGGAHNNMQPSIGRNWIIKI